MFIAFEGVDGAGKTTIAKRLVDEKGFLYTHEPTFTSKKADQLNLEKINNNESEVEFLLDRIKHQAFLRKNREQNIVCDRYIWGGLAYCFAFNKSIYNFIKIIYTNKFFIVPDCYVFVDTKPEICKDRGVLQNINQLKFIKQSYEITKSVILNSNTKIININGSKSLDEIFKDLYHKFSRYWPSLNGKIIQTRLF